MRRFIDEPGDPVAERFTADLESALLARALAEAGAQPDGAHRALVQRWVIGMFNASAHGLVSLADGRGELVWDRDGQGYRLVWLAPSGLACPLARLYAQEDGTWAALIVAGVRGSAEEAMVAAEWGISRLAT